MKLNTVAVYNPRMSI